MGYVSNPGGGGGGDFNLAEDALAEADPITDYPDGMSIMPASETANWLGQNARASIITWKTINGGWQWHIYHEDNESWHKYRHWIPDDPGWSTVDEFAPQSAFQYFVQVANFTLAEDAHAESVAITSYPSGFSTMPASAGANWGPNTGQAGTVEAARTGTDGTQTFTQYSNGNKFSRGYTSSAWSAWVALQ